MGGTTERIEVVLSVQPRRGERKKERERGRKGVRVSAHRSGLLPRSLRTTSGVRAPW